MPADVRAHGLHKSYGPRQVLNDVSFEVHHGRVVGLLGRNGAGKTTLLQCLLGVVTPESGTVEVLGGPPGPHNARRVGVAMDAMAFYPGTTVGRELAIWARALGVGRSRIADLIDLVGLTGEKSQRCAALSTGQRQRLRIAIALLSPDVELLVLDEPANGLDPDGIRWIRRFIRDQAAEGRTVLVSSHQLAEVQNTVDDVLLLNGGQIVHSSSLIDFTEGGVKSLEERFFDIAGS
ncbi:ABC transporter ATP-binding protein [Streptomyces sp. NPDC058284]|uniref:ABC transporter ATP-binding protein n=1 Tax=unclassified Streptomyces TaxID=2593676 RepID=UPI00364F3541